VDRFEQISRTVRALAPVPEPELRAFFALGKPLELATDEPFCALGEKNHPIGFLHRGLVRFSVLTDKGDEVIKDFGTSGGFTVSYGSAVLGEPARVAVIAVEPCELTVWSWAEMRKLLDRDVTWERFARRVAELLYVRKERRELAFLLQSASERYAAASHELGPALIRIPQYQLASYLGIAPESLSRLRGKAKRAKP
jgi:CRP-like cAMP-binding protein